MRKHSAIIGGVLTLGLGLVAIPGLATAGPVESALSAARQDIETGRCEQAYRRLARIGGLESRARLLAGQCRIRAGLYPEALSDLDRARGGSDLSSEQVGDVELYRAVVLYHLERYTEASAALDDASGLTREAAQLALYRGLIALREGDNDRAAPSLESAARLSPRLTEPVASYFAGLAWQGAAERTKAREAFQRVIDVDGDGPWGKEAKKLLASTELFPFFVRGSMGTEYDDNVILRGGVTQTPDSALNQAGERDWRGVWRIDAGVQLFHQDDWSGGVTAGYSGDAHQDLGQLDTHYPTIGAYLARRMGPQTTAQARYQFGHAWLNEDPYLQAHITEISLAHTWTKAGTTVVVADVLWNDLRFEDFDIEDGPVASNPGDACVPLNGVPCGPNGLDESKERDRDGLGLGAAVEHRMLLPVPPAMDEILEQIEIGGGYRFRWYDSEGDEWKHFAHILNAGFAVELPRDFSVAATTSYAFRDFDNRSTFPDSETINVVYALDGEDREEREINVELEIEKDLTENFSVSARYAYQETESNRRVYDFTRHIVGGYLNFRFD
ncbi:MAG: hypothetical protein GY910_13555 [bacterium]|nr:hypothetical protein [Deltaproteobacteria bacterium]MCP4905997.1 hypothetical protein [bacterium]